MVSVVRALVETEMRRRIIIPEPARGLVAEILRLDERRAVAALGAVGAEQFRAVRQCVRARVLADHHAEIFGDGRGGWFIQRAAADDAPAVRVPLLSANPPFAASAACVMELLPASQNKMLGSIAEINHRVAHHFHALLPLARGDVGAAGGPAGSFPCRPPDRLR